MACDQIVSRPTDYTANRATLAICDMKQANQRTRAIKLRIPSICWIHESNWRIYSEINTICSKRTYFYRFQRFVSVVDFDAANFPSNNSPNLASRFSGLYLMYFDGFFPFSSNGLTEDIAIVNGHKLESSHEQILNRQQILYYIIIGCFRMQESRNSLANLLTGFV